MSNEPVSVASAIKVRNEALQLLHRLASQADSDAAQQWAPAMIEMQQQKLQRHWSQFKEAAIAISSDRGVNSRVLEKNDDKSVLGSKVFTDVQNKLEELLKGSDPERFRPTPRVSDIMLDKFDGRYTKWTTWRSAFSSKVLDTKLPPDTKIDLLLSALSGEARRCAGEPERRDEDELKRMWTTLEHTYDNPYQIVTAHINSILDLPELHRPDAQQYQHIINVCDQELRCLRRFDYDVDSWSPIMAVIVLRKLDHIARGRWEMDRDPSRPPSLPEVMEYVKRRIQSFNNAKFARETTQEPNATHYVRKRDTPHSSHERSNMGTRVATDTMINRNCSKTLSVAKGFKKRKLECSVCKGDHPIFRCGKFMALELEQRQMKAKQLKLCYVCLSSEHFAEKCTWQGCKNCGNARHNKLLCPKAPVMRSFLATERKQLRMENKMQNFSMIPQYDTEELQIIGTAQFQLDLGSGMTSGSVRALCDSGSQVNLITEDCVQRWRLQKSPLRVAIMGVGTNAPIYVDSSVDTFIVSRVNGTLRIPIRFIVVSKIADHNPQRHFQCTLPSQIKAEDLADPTFNSPGPIDSLLGVGTWSQIVQEGLLKLNKTDKHFVAHKSLLGWVIAGGIRTLIPPSTFAFHTMQSDMNLDAQLERFWSVDNQDQLKKFKPEEQAAEDNFANTHSRNEEGRYVVTIPFRQKSGVLGHSRNTALSRFMALERRLVKTGNEDLAERYREFMQDYERAGHLVLAPPAPREQSQSYYVPYHIIDKKKFRVVFDASCTTSTGVSLNDLQLPGPKLQQDIGVIMLLFRTYRCALTADIVKMYRQVQVHQDHHNFQRILYRPSDNEPIREYFITCVIWGFTSATFNAVRALQQCGTDEGYNCPAAAEAITRNFYMDDLLWGGDTEQEIRKNKQEIIDILRRGGFELAKWASNSTEIAAQLSHTESQLPNHQGPGILGVVWDTKADVFRIKVTTEVDSGEYLTKRQIISSVAKVYDPTGCFLPIVVKGKMLIQEIWKLNIGWDEQVPEQIQRVFMGFQADIAKLDEAPMPRWMGTHKSCQMQLHIFSDASEHAYGACAYVRVTTGNEITVRLVTARNKVAPIKVQSIPRLELMGAGMSVQLANYVVEACAFTSIETFYWSDSTIVLHWLRKDASSLKPFVANRVSTILESTELSQWHHVPGNHNPADLVSRGCTVEHLKTADIWWKGPRWLALAQEMWPTMPQTLTQADKEVDQRESKAHFLLALANQSKELPLAVFSKDTDSAHGRVETIDTRASSLNKLIRTTAFIFRFIENCKSKTRKTSRRIKMFKDVEAITVEERKKALTYWIKQSQAEHFFAEGEALRRRRELPTSSKLLSLNPFINQEGLIRVGGRLGQSSLPDETKHQIILDPSAPIATLIIKNAHNHVLHGGTQLTMAHVRQKYWITRLRQATKKIIGDCVVCTRFRRERAEQLMGSLPSARTEPAFPFLRTGVDFAGPFLIRQCAVPKLSTRSITKSDKPRASVKCWVVVFVCLVTRAVHLDISYGLSVEAFMEAYARFISRRGPCKELWSDNGTNFIGSNKELKRIRKEWAAEWPDKQMANHGTTWRFIAPGAPHQGGLWEASVKSMKHHLRRAIGRRVLSGNQLYTIVTQIECCLNSRPIAPLTDDPSDLETLTPAHFLIGRPANFMPVADNVAEHNDNRLTLWGQQQKIQQLFWRRWKQEHLVTLQRRSKWWRSRQNIEEGDMVILTADNTPPAFWSVGRVKQVHKGPDGLVRNATILTSAGEKVRPIQKLCLLPKEPAQAP